MRFDKNPKYEQILYFLSLNPDGIKKFRYYNTRNECDIKNHLLTILMYDKQENIIGYSHLDNNDSKIWFGIMICDTCIGRGYGKKLLQETLSYYNNKIYLSVDKDNEIAISLYEKNGFTKIEEKDSYIIMNRN